MTIREDVPLRATRARLLRALDALPDEAFDWLAVAAALRVTSVGHPPLWPHDSVRGFTAASHSALSEVHAAADAYLVDDVAITPISQ